MSVLPNSMNVALELLAERKFAEIGQRCAGLVYEQRITYGLRRDLQLPLTTPKAKIPISIREFEQSDLPALIPDNPTSLSRKEQVELRPRRAHFEARIPKCYVAVDQRNGSPCYFQWLMGANENSKIQSFFPKNWFPLLQPDEALLENAYTPVAYRGNGIMSAAMALIAERAVELGCRYVLTFVEKGNIPSLRGCRNSGFSPYLVRTEERLFFNMLKRRSFGEFREGRDGSPMA
jgi:hypothetical protein